MVASGSIVRNLGERELRDFQKRWRAVFGRSVYQQTGKWVQGSDRASFHPRAMDRYLQGAAAEVEYNQATAERVIIVYEGGQWAEERLCQSGMKPDLSEFTEQIEAIISPPGLAWTASTGADVWDKVYFAYAEWVDATGTSLDAER